MRRGVATRALLALALLPACAAQPDGGPVDSERARLLAALPDDALSRGVYLFKGGLGDEISPGSLVAPIIGSLIAEADLVVETGAPPLTLLSGLPRDAELPDRMERVGNVAFLGLPEDMSAVEARLESPGEPPEALAVLARSSAPVGWAGPLPGCAPGDTPPISEGSLTVELSEGSVALSVTGPSAQELEPLVAARLQDEGPANSPGKPWNTILTDQRVSFDDGTLLIEAVPADLPGGLLRLLLDTRGLGFLRPNDC